MAKSDVKFNCGCGKSFDNPLEAGVHSDTTGHTLIAQGIIRPDNKKKEK